MTGKRVTGIVAALVALALLVRLPFWFYDGITRDEATYLLVGQALADGRLPYRDAVDIKPPLAYVPYALAALVFGRQIAGVRLVGTAIVVVSAWLIYGMTVRLWNRRTAAAASMLTVLGLSLAYDGQALMTEHVLLPPFVGSLLLLIRSPASPLAVAGAGALMAAATLVRQNVAFAAMAVGVWLLLQPAPSPVARLRRGLAYAVGGLAVAALVCVPFVWAGQWTRLWTYAVLVPWYYSARQGTTWDNLRVQAWTAFLDGPYLTRLLWLAAVVGLVALAWGRRDGDGARRRQIALLVAAGLGVAFGILKSGADYEHYLLQLVPFAAIAAAALANRLPGPAYRVAMGLGIGVAAVSAGPVVAEYDGMARRIASGGPLSYGHGHDLAAYLDRETPRGAPVYLLQDHIAYWLTARRPPTPLATHPTAINKQFALDAIGATGTGELTRIFDARPEVVVMKDENPFGDGALDALLSSYLDRDYVRVKLPLKVRVYRRSPR